MKNSRLLNIISAIALLVGTIISALGLFHAGSGQSFNYTNQHGDLVRIFGQGIYRNDSFFKAPIFRGTDCVILFVVCPLLAIAGIKNVRQPSSNTHLQLAAILGCFLYYAASIAFGVQYNALQLFYILLFSASFFGTLLAIKSINLKDVTINQKTVPYKGLYVFFVLTGIALIVAWLPDILTALQVGRTLLLIENYTTEITYTLDMGIIAPLCFITIYLLVQREPLGYVLAYMLLTLCVIVGIMLPVQTAFQLQLHIPMPLPVLITKVGSFVLLAIFAAVFRARIIKSIIITGEK